MRRQFEGMLATAGFDLHKWCSNREEVLADLPTEKLEQKVLFSEEGHLISRGIMPDELRTAKLWWKGPPFLKNPENTWPKDVGQVPEQHLPELMSITALPVVVERFQLFDDCSSYNTMVRVIALIKRLFQNRKRSPEEKLYGEFTDQENRQAMLTLVHLAQLESFPEVFAQLQKQVTIKNSSLIPLSPFVDLNGVLRVGGRLAKKTCSFDQKNQMILPPSHPFTTAIIRSVHKLNMHADALTTLCAIRREYWIIRGKNAVKKVIRECIRCSKNNARPIQQYMGDLPVCRLEGEYPFYRVGIDLCGPISIKQRNKRSTVVHKGWIVLFICLDTKAIHLEIVSELSTGAFMAAFDRFVSRRGKPATVWTDNGTNFVGTANVLDEWKSFFDSIDNQDGIRRAGNEIEWRFNPPEAPHLGGIWEANIRQTKSLLVKHTAGATLCFEELSTVLARIEAVLNSRPITPLSVDPEDFEPLTPGHFLIFRPLTAIARPEVSVRVKHPRSRFEHITQIIQHFWDRWSSEYLSSLQQSKKSTYPTSTVHSNLIVSMSDEPAVIEHPPSLGTHHHRAPIVIVFVRHVYEAG
ncbi:uncharacterized protein LOC135706997 [Ochlerotatus camptorhynchus]|uniref:uncharacterized protein LOC135706997 n=1 Tax=Ochlerotatus camptorhynchus TaxID=644619 RepID=UPI0031DDEEE1